MNIRSALAFFFIVSFLTACNLSSPSPINSLATLPATPTTSLPFPTTAPTTSPPPVTVIPLSPSPLSPQQAVIDQAFNVIAAIGSQDMAVLSTYVHPVDGLRFSPYAFVSESDLVFSAAQVAGSLTDNNIYTWGLYSGSGASIDLSFADFYSQFIYDVDFADAPQLSLNSRLGKSTSADNSFGFYQNAMVVEFHFPGFDPQLEGMDWRSLRLVFTEYNSFWYLVGIIHDQWTT